uniref:Uncharacterized protein LOC110218753 isoform X2 n=1 Tax=Phascolarctos cinereus TaxID=38626 RepID=A0A6P5LN82_PHACI|nr:uncharacterized protein LOC110218753 isoform X2 [Phascolarctos cinereus]XP_020857351.1 uncharacterized protein LOC110218753 isoform X2 [Phascolarctos cinereus]XP_020857352.1 uncharacterized protein LOC110218753 isoform X2 [Phascolarctos cinereus]
MVAEETLNTLGDLFFLLKPTKLNCQLCWLISHVLMMSKADVKPFYIIQCLSRLLEAVAAGECGSVNLASKLDDLVVLLSSQMIWKVINSDSHTLQNHNMALKSFHIMTRLCHQEMVKLFLKSMNCRDITEVIVTLHIFRDVFQEVPQTMELKAEVMETIINLIKENSKSVRLPLLQFIEKLGAYNYFTLQQGDVVINHLIKLSEIGSISDEETQELSVSILHLVALLKLINVLCQPMSPMAFVPLCKTATDVALKVQDLGHTPYLGSHHFNPTEYPSPQVVFVTLLFSIHTSLTIDDDDWLNDLIKAMLKKIQSLKWSQQGKEKSFLYRLIGYTLRGSEDHSFVSLMLADILNGAQEEELERDLRPQAPGRRHMALAMFLVSWLLLILRQSSSCFKITAAYSLIRMHPLSSN